MSALVVGVDPSSRKIAVVAGDPHLPVQKTWAFPLYKTTEKQTPESLARALDCMDSVVADLAQWAPGNRYAWVEDPLVGRGGPVATMKQSLVQGIVRGVLARSGFVVYGVNVSTWKKAVVGKGNADKADVGRTVRAKWPKVADLIGLDGDLADAAAICLYGQEVLRRGTGIDIAAASFRQKAVRSAARPARGGVLG